MRRLLVIGARVIAALLLVVALAPLGAAKPVGSEIDADSKTVLTSEEFTQLTAAHAAAVKIKKQYADLDSEVLGECNDLYELGKEVLAREREILRQEIIATTDFNYADHSETITDMVEVQLQKNIKANLLAEVNDFGRVEINSLRSNDKKKSFIVIRVVHNKTQKSVLYADVEHYVENLRHFRKWVGRQHFVAERDTALVTVSENGTPQNLKYFPRPESVFTTQYWSEYWGVVFEEASRSDKLIGAACTAGELAVMVCLFDGPMVLTGQMEALPYAAYGVKVFFGASIGMYLARTYQNWVELSPRLKVGWAQKLRTVSKRTSLSFLYGIALMAATQVGGLSSMSPTSVEGFLNWFLMLSNMQISNTVKDEVLKFVEIRGRLRMNTGDLVINSPLSKKPMWVIPDGKKMSEAQSLRILTGFIRYVDMSLTGAISISAVALASHVPGIEPWAVYGATLIASRLAYLSLAIVPLYFNQRYFGRVLNEAKAQYKINPSAINLQRVKNIELEVENLNQRIASTKNFFKSLPGHLLYTPVYIVRGLKYSAQYIYSTCAVAFGT